jgi:hypothetical protein
MGSPMKERRPGRRVSKAKSSVGGGEAGGRGMEGKGEGEEERMDEVGEKLREVFSQGSIDLIVVFLGCLDMFFSRHGCLCSFLALVGI